MKSLPRLTDNPQDVCIFSSRVNNIVAVVKTLNRPHYLYNPETVRATVDKMTSAMRYRWYDYAAETKEDEPDLIKISAFLSREAELCSRYAKAETTNERDRSPSQKKPQRAYATSSDAPSKSKCRKPPPQANQIEAISNVSERWEEAKKLNLCFRCLHKRGFRHRCRYQACVTDSCQGSHHPLLHSERRPDTEMAVEERGDGATTSEVVTTTRPHTLEKAFLKVIPIRIQGPAGGMDTFALLDEGSIVTLVEDEVARAVGATGPKEPFNIEGVAGAQISASTSMCVSLRITGRHANKVHEIKARTINRLHLSPQTIDESIIEQCKHLQDIAKDLIYQDGTPTILIGQDNWHIIISRSVKSGARGQPAASLTELGWVLHGLYSRTVLAWLRAGPRTYKPFVAHRVSEVEEETKVGEWRWVPTALNVADDATRGTPSDFGPDHRWFRGPDFLYHSEESWPREPEPTEPSPTVHG
ncbi:reverse transcriptase [Operophtera brumata]|uniref:Reverse transcriptase n=1 Tax=Operophtera brumata TaxID=104452 RepID=A0A0L7L2N6_OPEBR|nr:reverse transcriptase [Operophtera brumata]